MKLFRRGAAISLEFEVCHRKRAVNELREIFGSHHLEKTIIYNDPEGMTNFQIKVTGSRFWVKDKEEFSRK